MLGQKIGCLAALLLVSGCATIMEGTGQSVTISTDPAGAACTVERAGIRLGQVNPTPGSLRIDKSKNDIQVTCGKDGYEVGAVGQSPKFVGTTFGNIVLGGLVGVAVDAASGANFEYHSEIKVSLADRALVSKRTSAPTVARREFGIRANVVDASLVSLVKMDQPRGIFVRSVEPGGSAAAAGLVSGDVIVTFDGTQIENITDMQRRLYAVQPNSQVLAQIWRNGQTVAMLMNPLIFIT